MDVEKKIEIYCNFETEISCVYSKHSTSLSANYISLRILFTLLAGLLKQKTTKIDSENFIKYSKGNNRRFSH